MKLSLVILHTNSPKEVTENLLALKQARLPDATEVLVINNGDPEANARIPVENGLRSDGKAFDLQFFQVPNHGYPAGNNFGLSRAKGEYLCILNPDIEVEPDTFEKLLTYMEAHEKVGLVSPRLVFPNGQVQDNYRTFPSFLDMCVRRIPLLQRLFPARLSRFVMKDMDPESSGPVDWTTGAFQLMTRACWEAIGPKDERYFLFMSDLEICKHAWKEGFEVHFVGSAWALHREERFSDGGVLALFKSWTLRQHLKDALRYFWKHRKH